MKIGEMVDQFVESARAEKSKKTAATYDYGMRKWLVYMQECGLDPNTRTEALNTDHFVYFVEWLGRQKLRRSSKLVYIASLKSFADWATIHKIIQFNYEDKARLVAEAKRISGKKDKRLPKFPTQEEVELVRQEAYSGGYSKIIRLRNIALIEFLISTGCRAFEVAALNIQDIDLKNRQAKVLGKGEKERLVYLSEGSIASLKYYWAMRGSYLPSDPVFIGHDHGWKLTRKHKNISTKTMWMTVKALASAAGVGDKRFSPNFFRHAFATRILKETGNLAITQDLMGHATPASTRIYAKITNAQLQEAHRKVYG